jgi:SAM-dependent methyltransferase
VSTKLSDVPSLAASAVRNLGRVGVQAMRAKPPCLVCGAPGRTPRLVVRRRTGRQLIARICSNCGYVSLPDNTHDYTTSTSTKSLGMALRCGTRDRTGREFGMTQLGIEALRRTGLSVLIYGVGRSMDNLHVAKLPEVARVAIGDIMKIRDDRDFVDISRPATQTFDIVVAAEVIEHFEDPKVEFEKLLAFVAADGIVICSTNINDGHALSRVPYIFRRGHVSYYSPRSLRLIAAENGFRLDFRFPLSATGSAGPRKRYVILSRSPRAMEAVSDYFGRHRYAPSEPAGPSRAK